MEGGKEGQRERRGEERSGEGRGEGEEDRTGQDRRPEKSRNTRGGGSGAQDNNERDSDSNRERKFRKGQIPCKHEVNWQVHEHILKLEARGGALFSDSQTKGESDTADRGCQSAKAHIPCRSGVIINDWLEVNDCKMRQKINCNHCLSPPGRACKRAFSQ
eukprot:745779-Hanusia_phi.AAC.1